MMKITYDEFESEIIPIDTQILSLLRYNAMELKDIVAEIKFPKNKKKRHTPIENQISSRLQTLKKMDL